MCQCQKDLAAIQGGLATFFAELLVLLQTAAHTYLPLQVAFAGWHRLILQPSAPMFILCSLLLCDT